MKLTRASTLPEVAVVGQSLRLAIEIVRKHKVDLDIIREWSMKEGMATKCKEFLREVADPSPDDDPRA